MKNGYIIYITLRIQWFGWLICSNHYTPRTSFM